MEKQLRNSRILIIGLGASGRAAADCLLDRGAKVTCVDKLAQTLLEDNVAVQSLQRRGAAILQDNHTIDFSFLDLVVVSPGVSRFHPIYQQALKAGKEIIGEVELACRLAPDSDWIGITGTNGKTTVTMLVAHVLNACGKAAIALGNVGPPLSACIADMSEKIVVAELSSFQLEGMHSRILSDALLLNITPDHLDRYESMEDYAAAKFRIARCLKPSGTLFIEEATAKDWRQFAEQVSHHTYGFLPDAYAYTDAESLFFNQIGECYLPALYKGKKNHDVLNLLAAYAVCRNRGIEPSDFMKHILSFKKPPHRIEYVDTIEEVSYYDDSKATNVDAVSQALQNLQASIILIAGGVHKGASYRPWLSHCSNRLKWVLAIGEAAPLIEKELSSQIPVEICGNLDQAVVRASQLAKTGDCVLLSPGCSSYDMFRDYAHRGEEFKRCVHALSQAVYKIRRMK